VKGYSNTTTWPIIVVAQSNAQSIFRVFIYTIFKPDLKVLEFEKMQSKQKAVGFRRNFDV
jgi:hypothetical protein